MNGPRPPAEPRLFAPLLALLALGGCLGGDFEPDVGFPCHQSLECRAELECQYGRCRRPCTRDRDCPAGGACIASLLDDGSHDPARRVCTHSSEEACPDQGCPDYLNCGPDGICRERCDDELLPCGPGLECQPEQGVCLEDGSD